MSVAKKIHSFYSLNDYKIDSNNKYIRVLLLSYYMISRNEYLVPSYKSIMKLSIWPKLFEEYKIFIVGGNVVLQEKTESTRLNMDILGKLSYSGSDKILVSHD